MRCYAARRTGGKHGPPPCDIGLLDPFRWSCLMKGEGLKLLPPTYGPRTDVSGPGRPAYVVRSSRVACLRRSARDPCGGLQVLLRRRGGRVREQVLLQSRRRPS